MTIRLEKQNGAYAECKFQCGIEFIILLYAPSDSDGSYELYVLDSVDDIPDDLDDLDRGMMEYEYDTLVDNKRVDVFRYECYQRPAPGHWYDVWAAVFDRDDHYELDIYLREMVTHDG